MKKIAIIGHRGARAYAPENTIPGYAAALAQGVDSIDVDVVVTKDRVLVAYHDLLLNPDILCSAETGKYLANSKEELMQAIAKHNIPDVDIARMTIKNITFAELQERFRVKMNPKSPYAKWFPEQKNVPDTKLASLQEVVDFVNIHTNKTIPIQIEIKTNFDFSERCYTPEELANMVYDFIIKNDLVDRIKVQAFDWRILALLNQLDPKIKTAYLFTHTIESDWQKWFADSIVMDVANNMKVRQLKSLLNLVKQLGGYSYEPEDNELTYENVKLAKKLGLKIFVWNWPEHSGFVYNPELIVKLIDWQIDGFITDKPKDLRELLYKLGYNVPKPIKIE